MPYINRRLRDTLISNVNPSDAGELNFAITMMLDEYISKKGLNYKNINEVIGVLECAKLEMYRRVAAPYEDTKIKENGDVYNYNNTGQVQE